MQNMCTLFAVWTPPFPYEPPPQAGLQYAEYDKKYAEYEPPQKKYAKK
jgi:hypothetical protein